MPHIRKRFSLMQKSTSWHTFLFSYLASTMPNLLGAFRAVLRATLLSIRHTDRIQRTADDVVAHPGQILYATASHQNNGVFLQVVSDARDVRCHFHTVRQPYARHFSQGRVRLLRG